MSIMFIKTNVNRELNTNVLLLFIIFSTCLPSEKWVGHKPEKLLTINNILVVMINELGILQEQ